MKFYSTNRNLPGISFKERVSFTEALFMGIAPDNGLFMPETIPAFSQEEIISLFGKPYYDVAYEVLRKFLVEGLSSDIVKNICKEAYTFTIPIEKYSDSILLARMDQGPTASFKDFAAQALSRFMHILKPIGQTITVLVATSGDTGGAVGEAFKGLKETRVIILYPKKEVSSVQKKQLDGIGENVISIQIDGKFDDCQRLVKEAFSDKQLSYLHLTSANSINIGRILPQIIYYFYIYLKVEEEFKPIAFCVPTGNLGNALGCEIARRMGLPIKKIILATNDNDEIPKFLKKGIYEKISPSRNSISNAMNVGNPSNLARFFELYGGTVDKDGIIHKLPDIKEMRNNLAAYTVSDEDTIDTIVRAYRKRNILLEPHGAVGVKAAETYLLDNLNDTCVVLETAHPAKFPEVLEEKLDLKIEPPPSMKEVKEVYTPVELSNHYDDLKKYLSGIK